MHNVNSAAPLCPAHVLRPAYEPECPPERVCRKAPASARRECADAPLHARLPLPHLDQEPAQHLGLRAHRLQRRARRQGAQQSAAVRSLHDRHASQQHHRDGRSGLRHQGGQRAHRVPLRLSPVCHPSLTFPSNSLHILFSIC